MLKPEKHLVKRAQLIIFEVIIVVRLALLLENRVIAFSSPICSVSRSGNSFIPIGKTHLLPLSLHSSPPYLPLWSTSTPLWGRTRNVWFACLTAHKTKIFTSEQDSCYHKESSVPTDASMHMNYHVVYQSQRQWIWGADISSVSLSSEKNRVKDIS